LLVIGGGVNEPLNLNLAEERERDERQEDEKVLISFLSHNSLSVISIIRLDLEERVSG
jgi:hypothetical protein